MAIGYGSGNSANIGTKIVTILQNRFVIPKIREHTMTGKYSAIIKVTSVNAELIPNRVSITRMQITTWSVLVCPKIKDAPPVDIMNEIDSDTFEEVYCATRQAKMGDRRSPIAMKKTLK